MRPLVLTILCALNKFAGEIYLDGSILNVIQNLILAGRLSEGRRIANECIAYNNYRILTYQECPPNDDIVKTFKHFMTLFYKKDDSLYLLNNLLQNEYRYTGTTSNAFQSSNCWSGDKSINFMDFPFRVGSMLPDVTRWTECCSFFSRYYEKPSKCFDSKDSRSPLCCDLSFGTDNYLELPALKEPYLSIRLEQQTTGTNPTPKYQIIEVEQEGQLGLCDVSGVLWPSGYLLGLCLNNPMICGVPEIMKTIESRDFTMALELGAGIGFPSIAFANAMKNLCQNNWLCAPARKNATMVVATDFSKSSLGLVLSNSFRNDVGHLVNVSETDHMNLESVSMLRDRFLPLGGGFDLIFGSSLQGFFEGTSNPNATLWYSLDLLLSRSNPDAIVIFGHIRTGNEKIDVPSAKECRVNSFEIIRRISGDIFHMNTRDGGTSDFELVVLRRHICNTD